MGSRELLALSGLVTVLGSALPAQAQRAMTYADLFRPSSIGQVSRSTDGSKLLYTVTHGSFAEPSRDTQIHFATVDGAADRALTQWKDGDHRDVRWHPSGEYFGFTSSRNGGRQLFLMRPHGGEARQVSRAQGGVLAWGWSRDGRWLAYLAGTDAQRQIWLLDGEGREPAKRLTSHPTPIQDFRWRTASDEIFFVAPDQYDEADARRRRMGFQARPLQRGIAFDDFLSLYPSHIWRTGITGGDAVRVTDGAFRVQSFEESRDGRALAVQAAPVDRYADDRAHEVYLVDPQAQRVERLTHNGIEERIIGFSPDGSQLAISAPSEFRGRGVNEIHVRPVRGGEWRAVTSSFDNDVFEVIWKHDGSGFYFIGADGVNRQLFEVSTDGRGLRALTSVEGVIGLPVQEPGRSAVIEFTNPRSPADLYTAAWRDVGDRSKWTRVTRANPWVDSVQLAKYETVRWKSTDGAQIEGLLIYPVNHDPARSYPLITDIHGGPASAYQNSFDPTQGRPQRGYMHFIAAQGYAVFRPNYRGSSNYGAKFKTEISGDYWSRATEDIHTGIDHLIERGIAHPDSLGLMGWSAGGHWSNWMLVTSKRFKAISSGAGVANWISLYGQTDAQDSREFYIGRDPEPGKANKPWNDFDHWWAESPLKYIQNASTPTLFHYGERDRRVPMPQGQELHMALKHLGVPTEFIVYPGEPHGLTQPRNQLVKMMSEMGWFDKWIRGRESWLDWATVLEVADAIDANLRAAREQVIAEASRSH